MVDLRGALADAAGRIAEYREHLPMAKVTPIAHRREVRLALGELRDGPAPLDDVIAELVEAASQGLMASAGPRSFVTGGSLDAALVADVLATGWDQCAFNEALSPAAIAVEDVAGAWLKDILGLPSTASVGVVTGAQGANTTGTGTARTAPSGFASVFGQGVGGQGSGSDYTIVNLGGLNFLGESGFGMYGGPAPSLVITATSAAGSVAGSGYGSGSGGSINPPSSALKSSLAGNAGFIRIREYF